MEARVYLKLDREEIRRLIPYDLICETYSREIFRTGRAKRIRKEYFTPEEWTRCMELARLACKWALRTGAPEEITITAHTLALWERLAAYCMEI